MSNFIIWFTSAIVFLPAVVALLLWIFVPRDRHDLLRWLSFAATAVVFLMTAWMLLQNGEEGQFTAHTAEMQNTFSIPWISSFNIYYMMGTDGISFPLVVLTSFLSMLAMGASWNITKHVKAYCILYLLLVTGMLGVFLSLD